MSDTDRNDEREEEYLPLDDDDDDDDPGCEFCGAPSDWSARLAETEWPFDCAYSPQLDELLSRVRELEDRNMEVASEMVEVMRDRDKIREELLKMRPSKALEWVTGIGWVESDE